MTDRPRRTDERTASFSELTRPGVAAARTHGGPRTTVAKLGGSGDGDLMWRNYGGL